MSKYKPGMVLRACVPFTQPKPAKVYIDHVLPSHYADMHLIVYRVFGTRKRWWHEFMCTDGQMDQYVHNAGFKIED